MRLKVNEDDYIVGYGCFINKNYPEYEWINPPEEITDDYNHPLYFWDGEKPVYKPQGYTTEQTEQLRSKWIRAEIEALYPQDVQLKIMMEKDYKPDAYAQMQADRLRIKAESKEKDFQITEDIKCK